jgi:nicotinamidase-related amidase
MIRWAGMEILETLDEVIDPKHTALLLWDVTQGAMANAFNADAVAQNTRKLLSVARRRRVLTLFARQSNMRWEDAGPAMVRMRMKQLRLKNLAAYRRAYQKRAGAGRWLRGLAPGERDIVFEKSLPNAFIGTNFEGWLLKHSIKTIVLAGVAAETGVDGTARTAVDRGYYTVIVKDCVGSPFEDTYQAAFRSLQRIFDVYDSAQIIETWQKRAKK